MLTYAAITPARDEAENLPRLAHCLAQQTALPAEWVVVENGSTDATLDVLAELAATHSWISYLQMEGTSSAARGKPIVRALHKAIDSLRTTPDVVVVLDADISFEPQYFARLLEEFANDPHLGIASGSGYELRRGRWRQRHLTGSTVWGATRAFRKECLEQVLPFDERLGWDGVDEFKANSLGWRTRVARDLPFRHHRREGERDASRWHARLEQGRVAWYVGYRLYYVLLRAAFNLIRDAGALGIAVGYLGAALRRQPQCSDPSVREYVRGQQSLANLPRRAIEALGGPGVRAGDAAARPAKPLAP
ncbi:MAG: glycosyltransferase family 2 protein [Gaiellaceae bacterium]